MKGFLIRFLLLAFVWWFLTDGALDSWALGIPAAIGGALLSQILPPLDSFSLRILGALQFIAFFISQSVLAGIDVGLRSCRPQVPLAPGFINHDFHLKNRVARIFFIHAISLLPGTLSVSLKEDQVLVHVLDQKQPNAENLILLENKVAALFGAEG